MSENSPASHLKAFLDEIETDSGEDISDVSQSQAVSLDDIQDDRDASQTSTNTPISQDEFLHYKSLKSPISSSPHLGNHFMSSESPISNSPHLGKNLSQSLERYSKLLDLQHSKSNPGLDVGLPETENSLETQFKGLENYYKLDNNSSTDSCTDELSSSDSFMH